MPVRNGKWVPRTEPIRPAPESEDEDAERLPSEYASATVRSDEAVAEAIVNATGVDINLVGEPE
jgi:hypothetical protein